MVVTYIFVLETNTGATIHIGGLRIIGTLCGVVFAYVVCDVHSYCDRIVLYSCVSGLGHILPESSCTRCPDNSEASIMYFDSNVNYDGATF